jgi:hypothetical protein
LLVQIITMKNKSSNCLYQSYGPPRATSQDPFKVAFTMADWGSCNPNLNRNINEFGGIPFITHRGKYCHRGANPFKKPEIHPADYAKKVIYRENGSGRDGYISCNSGGLTAFNGSGVKGSDVCTLFQGALR